MYVYIHISIPMSPRLTVAPVSALYIDNLFDLSPEVSTYLPGNMQQLRHISSYFVKDKTNFPAGRTHFFPPVDSKLFSDERFFLKKQM